MLSLTQIKTGKNIVLDGEPYVVMSHEHSKMGRAGAVLRTKLKNLINGAVMEKTFQGADKIEEADITKSKAQFLYNDGEDFYFMDAESYDQFPLPKDAIGEAPSYLIEGTEVTLLLFNGIPVNIELPVKVTLEVTEAPPNIKGDTQSGGTKMVTLQTGLSLAAPLFVEVGNKVIVNTERGEYVGKE
jgi:elongation factor P